MKEFQWDFNGKLGILALMKWLQDICDTICNLKTYSTPDQNPAVNLAGTAQHPPPQPPLIAHRGAWDETVLENTREAFSRARDLHLWGVELDVHFTKDNIPVVHHDPTLQRVLHLDAKIAERTWSELSRLTPHLARLEEVLALSPLHFMIELKTRLTDVQKAILLGTLEGRTPGEDYHLLTLRPDLIFQHGSLPPAVWVLVAEFNVGSMVALCLEKNYGGVAGHYLLMTKNYVTQLHNRGMKAGAGFIPNPNLYNREWSRGVDWVFTNHARALSSLTKKL